jgi:hypothetical protein
VCVESNLLVSAQYGQGIHACMNLWLRYRNKPLKYPCCVVCHHTSQNQNKKEHEIYYIAPSRNLARIVKSYTVEAHIPSGAGCTYDDKRS